VRVHHPRDTRRSRLAGALRQHGGKGHAAASERPFARATPRGWAGRNSQDSLAQGVDEIPRMRYTRFRPATLLRPPVGAFPETGTDGRQVARIRKRTRRPIANHWLSSSSGSIPLPIRILPARHEVRSAQTANPALPGAQSPG
jgi:hypothetical protein